MRLALPGSALVHAGALGLLLVGFSWPESDDAPAPASVSVLVVPVTTVATNTSEALVSDSTVSAASAGSQAVPLVPVQQPLLEPMAERAEAVEPMRAAEVVRSETPAELAPEPAETIEIAELGSKAPDALEREALPPSRTELAPAVAPAPALEPVASEDLSSAPVPQTATIQRQSAPIVHAPRRAEPPQPKPAASGNEGRDSADSVAAAAQSTPKASGEGAGGSADVARYPGQVVSKLRSALRRADAQRGEVVVRFTVLPNGTVTGIGIARSSGNGSVDEAGLAIVRRAAPFPPIPPAAGRGDWTFDVPLAF